VRRFKLEQALGAVSRENIDGYTSPDMLENVALASLFAAIEQLAGGVTA